jgi:cobyrinic acid a,c-diamide synthase
VPQTAPARRIAVAHDAAFAFHYPHMLAEWHAAGAQIAFFSPLANEPVPEADLVFLPGGYPELHAETLSGAQRFLRSLRRAAREAQVYGECGGYMLLGETLVDAQGNEHRMAGLLPLKTSFADRKLHLGYRSLVATQGPMAGRWAGHEFHYATTVEQSGRPLFQARDAEGTALPAMGLVQGNVCGSFAHLIDRDPALK